MFRLFVVCFVSVVVTQVTATMCQDGKSECPDDSTCCITGSGSYGCCPLTSAVCCEDHVHCCPQDTTCDVPHGRCIQTDGGETELLRKFAARRVDTTQSERSDRRITCPDRESECPRDSTCCEMTDGSWGCCPFREAVCCEDGQHCCPIEGTCDASEGRCIMPGGETIFFERKTKARRREPEAPAPVERDDEAKPIKCPDHKSTCPDKTTCCQTSDGDWACCPQPQAVCCSDHLHCCPHGSECDVEHRTCNKADGTSQSWLTKVPAKPLEQKEPLLDGKELTACPDDANHCLAGSTCCQTEIGGYGCCPFTQGVCCRDKTHCCPSGTTCDAHRSLCVYVSEEHKFGIAWKLLTHSHVEDRREGQGSEDVEEGTLCAEDSKCSKGTKCCPAGNGFGCCPDPFGVCCPMGTHCCPSGFTCTEEGGCAKTARKVFPFSRFGTAR